MHQIINNQETLSADSSRQAGENVSVSDFVWLPRTPGWRIVVGAFVFALMTSAFTAYLRPNMVFDLANMIFCG